MDALKSRKNNHTDARFGMAGRGRAGLGMAWHGLAWQGEVKT